MQKRLVAELIPLLAVAVLVSPFCWGQVWAAEKLNYATAFKAAVSQQLPVEIALEKGLWRKQGLNVEHIPFRAGSRMGRAMAAGKIDIGTGNSPSIIQQITRGVPVIMIAATQEWSDWSIWVLPGGPVKRPADLKGRKMGISRIGGTSHAMARVAVKSLGIEKEVKIVAVGGTSARVAALKTGVIDAFPQALSSAAPMVEKGGIRRLMDLGKKLPQPWIDQVIVARMEFIRTNAELAKKAMRGILQAIAFIKANPEYAVKKVMSIKRYNRAAAELSLKGVVYSDDPVIKRAAVENVRGFLIDYGLIKAQEAPPVEKLFTNRLVR
ncbi:MAG: ABC transporter substrate-binding protein [Thermodesulfobacteriota bacterium]